MVIDCGPCLCLHILSLLCTPLYPQELWWGQQHSGDVAQIQQEVRGCGESLNLSMRHGGEGDLASSW